MFGIVTVDSRHSHEIETARMLSFRTPTPETTAAFEKYFENGMTPAAAIAYHDSLFELCEAQSSSTELESDRPAEVLMQIDRADSSKNPNRRTIYHMHSKCRTKILGKLLDVRADINIFWHLRAVI